MHTARLYEYQLGDRWLVVGNRAWNVSNGKDGAGIADLIAASKADFDKLRHYPLQESKPLEPTSWLVVELNRHQLLIKHALCSPGTRKYLGLAGI